MSRVIVIAQGGGPTAVINQTLVGAVIEARHRHEGARVLGARHGVRGIAAGDFVDLSAIAEEDLRAIAATPSAALGSTRDKPDADYCGRILEGLRGAGADALSDAAAFGQHLAALAQLEALDRLPGEPALHRLGAGLENVDAPVHPVPRKDRGDASTDPPPPLAVLAPGERWTRSRAGGGWRRRYGPGPTAPAR